MAKLYLITGPAGVGKSTVSRKLAESKEKSVLIEGDDIYHQVVGGYIQAWKEGNHLDIFWEVCFETISIYLQNGYDVVFNYIMSDKDLERFKKQFPSYEKFFVVLMVNGEILLQRDKERPLDCQMKERCLVLLKEFAENPLLENYFLDTSRLSVEETIAKMEKDTFRF